MKSRYLILDCFVDEPACFGVPPFIAPYPRYVYGALIDAGIMAKAITYTTIEDLRAADMTIEESYRAVFLIGGAVVPGKYLGSRIGTLAEITRIMKKNRDMSFILGGEASRMMSELPPRAVAVTGDIEKYAYSLATGSPVDALRDADEIARWGPLGAGVVEAHPSFPHIICEVETYRGCPRQQHCSFCSEGLFGSLQFRKIKDIVKEVDALIARGVSRFRLGRQADILQYGTAFSNFRSGFPEPDTGAVIELFRELQERKRRGEISVLNIDNANPGTIYNFPDESKKMLAVIADAVTPGDTLALGIESFDPAVVAANGLKVRPKEALEVIRLVNETCGDRVEGIPKLLPGINLIQGLRHESMESFEMNHRWLVKMLEEGLLLKRINIRKLLPFPGTPLYNSTQKKAGKLLNRFEYYRDRIRHDVDIPMLKSIYPPGTVLRDVQILEQHQGHSLGKQIASYSITARFPCESDIFSFQNALVLGHRERSLFCLPLPLAVNDLPQKAFEAIPGIGKHGASDIVLRRPFENMAAFLAFLDEKGLVVPAEIRKQIL